MNKEKMILHWEAFMKHRADGCEQEEQEREPLCLEAEALQSLY